MRLGDLPLTARAGYQPIAWSAPSIFQGPLRNMDTQDSVAANRPGAIADETSVPAPAIRIRTDGPSGLSLDGFVQLAHEPSPVPVCGTFFSPSDYGSGLCDKVLSGNATDPVLAGRAQNFMARSSIDKPPDSGQFGASMRFAPPDGRWHVQGFFANVHSRTAYLGVQKTGRSGDNAANGPLLAGNPHGLNATYILSYPVDIQWFALVGSAAVAGGRLSLEYAHSPSQPVPLNIADLLTAFGTPATTPTILRASERTVPSGGVFNGWDRLRVEDLKIGYAHTVRNPAFADEISVFLEGVVKSVRDLPDPSTRRYRRPDVYGAGPYADGPTCTGSAEQCTTAGYVSATATAIRLRVATKHTAFSDWRLMPSVTLGKDIQGWSYDNALSEGRTSLAVSLRVAKKAWYLDWSMNHRWGAPYGNLDDRDIMSLALGFNF